MKQPVDHITRPMLPWRQTAAAITECGYDASKVATLTREEFFARLKEYGQQRTSLMTCMTCMDTARRHPDWNTDPRGALQREIEWEKRYRHDKNEHVLRDELVAIAQLIERHLNEFQELMARQDWISKKESREASK